MASDNDTGQNSGRVRYSLVPPLSALPNGTSDGVEIFAINATSGVITLQTDLEPISGTILEFVLTVVASDEGEPPLNMSHMLTLRPVPVPTFRNHSRELTIDEELAIGYVVSELVCTEIGPPSNSTQISLSGPGSEFFRIEGMGDLVMSGRIDYEALSESEREFAITATCTNRFNQMDSIPIAVTLVNINDNPFSFTFLRYNASIRENVTTGELHVLTVDASDRDMPNADVIYSLESSDEASDFVIFPQSGEIFVHGTLDRETKPVYEFSVNASYRAVDGTVQRASAVVTVTISDINDERPKFEENAYFVTNITTLNEAGDLVVIASAVDADADANGHVTYRLQQNNSIFEINEATGAIYIASPPTPILHTFVVVATDNGATPLSSTALVYVYVQLYHNRIVLTPSERVIQIPENTPAGSLIGNVTAVVLSESNGVPNGTVDEVVVFEILNGSEPDSFTIDEITGEIYTLASLDYEALAREYNLNVRATLNSSFQEIESETMLIVRVENVNDNAPRFSMSLYATAVEQLILPNMIILTVSAIDPDALSSIEYSLAVTDSSFFQINSSTGEISAIVELDTPRDYRFTAVARDGGTEESSAAVFISATQLVSVTPTFTRQNFNFSIAESVTLGTFVGVVTILTREDSLTVDFSEIRFRIKIQLLGNRSRNPFHIDPESGNISTQAVLDFETQQVYVFHVEVYNAGNGSVYDVALVKVQVEDVNDNPPLFDQSLYTHVVNASLALDSVVTVLSVTDRDSGSNAKVTYAFERQDTSLFGFSLNSSSGEIAVSNSTLLPGDYYLSVVASDGGDPTMTATATIFIAVIPVIPTDIAFTEQAYNFEIVENELPDVLIGVIQALDSRSSLVPPAIEYSAPNVTDCFNIDMQSGEVKLSCTSLDRESTASYELEILAQVGSTTTRGVMRIQVLDINDNAPVFSPDIYTEDITDRFGNTSAVLRVRATDLDNGDNGTVVYSILAGPDSFRINSTSGEIFLVNATVEIGVYRLVIVVADRGIPVSMESTALVFITVTRDRPQGLQFASNVFNVTENSPPGTAIGTVALTTTDGDTVNPLEFPNNLQFSIVGGDSTEFFLIDEETGLLSAQTQNLDREVAASHVIEILADFTQFITSIRGVFVINVLDVNDNAPVMLATYSTTMDDSAVLGEVVFNITATDIDIGPNSEAFFDINPEPATFFGVRVAGTSQSRTFGEIFVNDTLTPGIYRFMLTATDSGVPSMQSRATVEIIVEHAIPETISFSSPTYTFDVIEETREGTFVGNVSILPETPALDDLVFVVTGGSGRDFFNVNPATGEILKSHRRINREQVDVFSLDVRAYLPHQIPPLMVNTSVTINVLDINDNFPRFTEGIYESVGIDTDQLDTAVPLTAASASDMDIGSNAIVEYRIHSIEVNQTEYSNSAPFFVLNNHTGELFAASSEIPVGVYALNISGSDQGQPVLTSYTSVTILVLLPAPTSIAFTVPSEYTFRLPEQSGITRFARVMLEGIPDYLLQYVTYTSQNPYFTVALHTGDITSRQDFDYEVETEFNFLVISTFVVTNRIPRIDLTAIVNVTVEIVDINDNTPYFISFPTEITQYEERQTAEVVHTIFANDSDSGSNSELVYTILNADLNVPVTINNVTGQLIAAAGLDRENAEEGQTHTIIIRACDSGEMVRCVRNTTLFRLLDINDNSPSLISGFTYRVDERLPAQTDVFSFEGTDPDVGANSTIRYFLTSSNVPFTCNEITGQVTLTEELDYETRTSYDITLTLRDTGAPELDTEYTNITVEVNNLPDNTPQFNQTVYNATTDPTVMAGNILFQVQATDADVGFSNDALRYAITGIQGTGNNGEMPQLRMEANTGQIKSVSEQVFITEAVFHISILVYDQSRFNLTNTTTLIITVVPNSLTFTQSEYSVTIDEDASPGSSVISLGIETLSASSDITYMTEIREPPGLPDPLPFTTSGNGRPTVDILLASSGAGLDREIADRYVLDITASRPNEDARTRLIVLVADVNDNPPMFRDANGTVVYIDEDAVTPTVVTRSNATDADIGENARLEFTILNRDHPFEINRETGVIRTRGVLDYEAVQSYSVIISVRDSGTPRLENRITYIINVVNINDALPNFAASAYFGEVYAGAPPNSFALHTELRVTDADDVNNEQQLTFTIFPQNQNEQLDDYQFSVDSTPPYRIKVENLPEEADRESRLLELFVQVADEGNKLATVPLYISIFTSNNLAFFLLNGVAEDSLLSCVNRTSSICAFRQTLAELIREDGSSEQITFYNNTVESQGTQTS